MFRADDDDEVCCARCGSTDVDWAVWKRTGETFGSWNEPDAVFCNACEGGEDMHNELVDAGAEPERFAALRAVWHQNNPPLRFRDLIEKALAAAGLPVQFCGLNADWSVCAWHLSPGKPNLTDGDLYLLDDEETDQVHLVRQYPSRLDRDDGDGEVDTLAGPVDLDVGIRVALSTLAGTPWRVAS